MKQRSFLIRSWRRMRDMQTLDKRTPSYFQRNSRAFCWLLLPLLLNVRARRTSSWCLGGGTRTRRGAKSCWQAPESDNVRADGTRAASAHACVAASSTSSVPPGSPLTSLPLLSYSFAWAHQWLANPLTMYVKDWDTRAKRPDGAFEICLAAFFRFSCSHPPSYQFLSPFIDRTSYNVFAASTAWPRSRV